MNVTLAVGAQVHGHRAGFLIEYPLQQGQNGLLFPQQRLGQACARHTLQCVVEKDIGIGCKEERCRFK